MEIITSSSNMEALAKEFVLKKSLLDFSEKLRKGILDENKQIFVEIDNILKQGSAVEDEHFIIKDGEGVRYKGNINIFRLNDYCVFNTKRHAILNEEGEKVKKDVSKAIRNGKLENFHLNYVKKKPPSTISEIDIYIRSLLDDEVKEAMKKEKLTLTALFSMPFEEKIKTASRITGRDLTPILDSFKQTPFYVVSPKKGENIKLTEENIGEYVNEKSFPKWFRNDLALLKELSAAYREDPVDNLLFVLKELRALSLKEEVEMIRYELLNAFEKGKDCPPSIHVKKNIKLDIEFPDMLEEKGIVVYSLNGEKLMSDYGTEEKSVIILGVAETLEEAIYIAEETISRLQKFKGKKQASSIANAL